MGDHRIFLISLLRLFSCGAPLLGEGLSSVGIPTSSFLNLTLFLSLFGGTVLLGAKSIHKTNLILSLGMLLVFPILIFLGASEVSQSKLFLKPLSFEIAAIPILFGAFGYHNVIPSLSSSLGKEKKTLRAAILFGTFLAFLLYIVWQWLVLGSLSPQVLQDVLGKGLPVTYALAQGSSMKVFVLGQIFAFLALTTSFLGVSFSLVDFIQDGLEQGGRKVSRFLCVILSFFPPLFCVWINPHLFDRALGVAGGFGETLLNGILPVLLFLKVSKLKKFDLKKSHKIFLGALLFFSVWVILIEFSHLLLT